MTTKTQKQFRLDSLTTARLSALADKLDLTETAVVTHAIGMMHYAHMSTPPETRDLDELTEDVCDTSAYPHTTEMRQECRDWLADGDPDGQTVEALTALWDEHLQDAGICLRVTVTADGVYQLDEDVSWWPEVEAEAEAGTPYNTVRGWRGWSQVWRVFADGDEELYFRP